MQTVRPSREQRSRPRAFVRTGILVLLTTLVSTLSLLSLLTAPLTPYLVAAPVLAQEPQQTQEGQLPPQMRAFWVDASNPGFLNHAQVDELVNNVVRSNANTIIAQMRRHGDAWYNKSIEPRALRTRLPPPEEFDPLEYLIARAHQENIRVHAWLVVSVVCRRSDPLYGHPQHVCTSHGPDISGPERWTTETYGGAQIGDLDFGHPGTIVYFETLVQHLVRNYPTVDGIHLDFIRYGGRNYGYNAVSLDRFRQVHGLPATYRPDPNDALWSQWRRDGVTEMVRRVYIRTKAIDPTIEVSAATITWGGIGSYSPDDWPNSAAYRTVFQDWRAWLQEGILDFAVPMHYFAEGNSQQRAWYESWIAWDHQNTGRRAIVPGVGAWLSSDLDVLHQMNKALRPDENGHRLSGVALYSYNQPLAGSSFERRRVFMDQLRAADFTDYSPPPDWPWIAYPTHGHLQGIAMVNGAIVSDYRVSLLKDGQWVRDIPTSYDGWYGAVDLEPGFYQVYIEHPTTGESVQHEVAVQAGLVTNGP